MSSRAFNSFYYDRAVAAIGAIGQAQYINYETKNLKEWFIHQMRNRMAILGKKKSDGIPVSDEYVKVFNSGGRGDQVPHPEMTSWMQLFALYSFFRKQARGHIKGLAVPTVNEMMAKIIKETKPYPILGVWYELPVDYLASIGHLQIHEIDRDTGQSETRFVVRHHNSRLNLGYREMFSVPKFGEIYCETNSKESVQLVDRLIAHEGFYDIRYYAVIMCKKLPVEIFGRNHR